MVKGSNEETGTIEFVTLLLFDTLDFVRYALMRKSGIPVQFGRQSGIIPIPKPLDH